MASCSGLTNTFLEIISCGKSWVLAFPFSKFKDRMQCAAGVGVCFKPTQARAITEEANMERGIEKKGLQEGPAFGLGLVSEGGSFSFRAVRPNL